jgi:hypothetical protein
MKSQSIVRYFLELWFFMHIYVHFRDKANNRWLSSLKGQQRLMVAAGAKFFAHFIGLTFVGRADGTGEHCAGGDNKRKQNVSACPWIRFFATQKANRIN